MRLHRRHNRPANSAALATTASALIALVAVAAAMSSLPGANVRASILETRGNVDAPTVRQVAAAVAAAARDLVGAETITAALPAHDFTLALGSIAELNPCGGEATKPIQSRAIEEHLIDLPPPVC